MAKAKGPSSAGLPLGFDGALSEDFGASGLEFGGQRDEFAQRGHDLDAVAGVAEEVSGRLVVIGARVEQALEDASPDDPNRARLLRIQDACNDAIALTRQLLA